MTKIMLVCNFGMSTSLMAQSIEEESGGEYEVHAYGENEYQEHLDGVKAILIGPQGRHLVYGVQKAVDYKIPVESIEPRTYGMLDGAKVINQIKRMLGEKTI